MKFASKCPKCGGEIQTKSIHKSIGLGFIDIPIAQFCLNPVCDWYQDFSEAKRAEDIKEGVVQIKIPSFKKKAPRGPQGTTQKTSSSTLKSIAVLGGIIVFIAALVYVVPLVMQSPGAEGAAAPTANETQAPTAAPTQTPAMSPAAEPRTYAVKFTVRDGFYPLISDRDRYGANRSDIVINRSDAIVWSSIEDWQPRVFLVSREGLFGNKLMLYSDKFSYQFNQPGNYTFALADYTTLKEFPNTTSRVTVR